MTPVPDIPQVMNGEGCPGCRTPIWGLRPKQCFMCGYNFENPREEDLLENRALREHQRLYGQAEILKGVIADQKARGAEVRATLDKMVKEFLNHEEFPHNWSPDKARTAFEKFIYAEFPNASFGYLEVDTWSGDDQVDWRIRGEMDLDSERILGIPFEYARAYPQ